MTDDKMRAALVQALEALRRINAADEDRDFLSKHEFERCWDAITAAEAALAEPVAQPVAITVGSYGSAFDAPGTKRAYTYKHQPPSLIASQIGRAALQVKSGGDRIDTGLSLLQALEANGFGVFQIGAEATAPAPVAPRQPLTDEQFNAAMRSALPGLPLSDPLAVFAHAVRHAVEQAHDITGDAA